uniref:Secreted protein n=1 Tax=Rhipicephalus appendiculatus TaxID=34631 RepID=A0A131YK97_RHIAP
MTHNPQALIASTILLATHFYSLNGVIAQANMDKEDTMEQTCLHFIAPFDAFNQLAQKAMLTFLLVRFLKYLIMLCLTVCHFKCVAFVPLHGQAEDHLDGAPSHFHKTLHSCAL